MSTLTAMRSRKNISWMAVMVGIAMFLSYQLLFERGSMRNQVQETLYLHQPLQATPSPTFVSDEASPANESSSHGTPSPELSTPALKDDRFDCKIVQQIKKENIMVVMRTGGTEAYSKLPMQFLTTLRCFDKDDILLYSDMDDTMGQFKITDILTRIPEETKSSNPDFDVYRSMKEFQATGQEMSSFKMEMSDTEHTTAWTLDKYKFQHMLEDAYFSKPEGKWYFFMETDTYPIWSNVLRYIHSLDPAKPLYFGSVAELSGKPFAHGGSGFVISRVALAKLFEGKERGYASKWDELTMNECCGDYIVGASLTEVNVPVHNVWPMINGEYPATMPFGDNHWCQSLLTMHHIPSPEMNHFWKFEQERGFDTPIQIKDLYFKFIEPKLKSHPVARSWDNLADDIIYRSPGPKDEDSKRWLNDIEKEAHLDVEKCELACKSQSDCYQFLWKSGVSGEITLARALREKEQLESKRYAKIEKKIEIDMGYPNVEEHRRPPTASTKIEEEDPDRGPTCSLGHTIKLGKYARGKENQYAGPGAELWISGWDMEKIEKWVNEHQSCGPRWVTF